MEPATPNCLPLCAQVGHDFVTLTIWRCRHHEQLTAHIASYRDDAHDPLVRVSSDWSSGPFTADMDLRELLEYLSRVIDAHLLDGPSTV